MGMEMWLRWGLVECSIMEAFLPPPACYCQSALISLHVALFSVDLCYFRERGDRALVIVL